MSHGYHKLQRALKTTALYGVSLLAVVPLLGAINALDAAANNAIEPPRQVPLENQPYLPVTAAPTAMPTSAAPVLPPVNNAVKAQAEQELSRTASLATPTLSAAPPGMVSFPPPAPLSASPHPAGPQSATLQKQPEISELPKIIFPPLAPEVQTAAASSTASAKAAISDDSKRVLSGVPSRLDAKATAKGGQLKLDRASPELKSLITKALPVESFESGGLSIKVQRPGLDTSYELNKAYTELTAGNNEEAIDIYKNILSAEPENEDALFGAASLYHRLGQIEKARPFYGRLLKANPQHREGLNNFLVLISDESPEEALAELERLEQRNPEYSSIPAQQAIVLKKLGYLDQARERMIRAVELAPDNLTYKYNLAVILDQQGDSTNASALYRLLIEASLRGAKVPASTETLQKRLNYITVHTHKPVQNSAGNS